MEMEGGGVQKRHPNNPLVRDSERPRIPSVSGNAFLEKENTAATTKAEDGPKASLKGEEGNVALLIALYFLQGIPMGLVFGSIPFLLKANLSLSEIGLFSCASYPYSFKLLWSPIVDSYYIDSVGRRKSWVIPTQILIGVMMMWLGGKMDSVVAGTSEWTVKTVTSIFFLLVVAVATQDIAVDGWALTMLREENIDYASMCQSIGLTAGFFVSFTVFLAMNSAEFCESTLRPFLGLGGSQGPLISLGGYMWFWGVAFLVMTAYLILFRPEKPAVTTVTTTAKDSAFLLEVGGDSLVDISGEKDGAVAVYRQLWSIVTLPHMLLLVAFLAFYKFPFQANEAGTVYELMERGLSKETLAMFALFSFPAEIGVTVLVGKWVRATSSPLSVFKTLYPLRIAVAVSSIYLIKHFPVVEEGVPVPFYYTCLIFASSLANTVSSTGMFVAQGSFFSRISDPLIGGTYQTLLNTLSNLGGTWPKYPVLSMMDNFSQTRCASREGHTILLPLTDGVPTQCVDVAAKALCVGYGGVCETVTKGYFPVAWGCVILGVIGLWVVRWALDSLDSIPTVEWRCPGLRPTTGDDPTKIPSEVTPFPPTPIASEKRKKKDQ